MTKVVGFFPNLHINYVTTRRLQVFMCLIQFDSTLHTYTWNLNDPCFDWNRPSFGGFNPQNKGQTASRYIYIYICYMLIIKEKYGKYITDWSVTHPVWGGLSR